MPNSEDSMQRPETVAKFWVAGPADRKKEFRNGTIPSYLKVYYRKITSREVLRGVGKPSSHPWRTMYDQLIPLLLL